MMGINARLGRLRWIFVAIAFVLVFTGTIIYVVAPMSRSGVIETHVSTVTAVPLTGLLALELGQDSRSMVGAEGDCPDGCYAGIVDAPDSVSPGEQLPAGFVRTKLSGSYIRWTYEFRPEKLVRYRRPWSDDQIKIVGNWASKHTIYLR